MIMTLDWQLLLAQLNVLHNQSRWFILLHKTMADRWQHVNCEIRHKIARLRALL